MKVLASLPFLLPLVMERRTRESKVTRQTFAEGCFASLLLTASLGTALCHYLALPCQRLASQEKKTVSEVLDPHRKSEKVQALWKLSTA